MDKSKLNTHFEISNCMDTPKNTDYALISNGELTKAKMAPGQLIIPANNLLIETIKQDDLFNPDSPMKSGCEAGSTNAQLSNKKLGSGRLLNIPSGSLSPMRKWSRGNEEMYVPTTEIPKWLLYTMLIMTTGLCFGNYYVYDFPQALETPFMEVQGITPDATNLFYAAYGLPNTVLTFFGGIFIQWMGDQKSQLLFTSLVFIGHGIFGLGTVFNNYWMMFMGRVIFGLGGENNLVVQCFIVEKWFSGRLLSVAFGLVMVFNLLGTTVNNYVTPFTFDATGGNFSTVFLVSYIAIMISVTFSITYCFLDNKYKYLLMKAGQEEDTKFKCSDILKMNKIFWCLFLAQLTTSNCYYQFMNFGTTYSEVRFGNSYEISKNYMAMIPFMIIILLLAFSQFTERCGMKGWMIMISGLFSAVTMIVMYVFPNDCGVGLMIPYAMFAIWFSLYSASMWASVPMVVEKKMMGVAYGLINAGNNQGLALYPFVFGAINKSNTPEAYDKSVQVLFILACVGSLSCIAAWYLNRKQGKILDNLETAESDNIDKVAQEIDAKKYSYTSNLLDNDL